MRYTSSILRNLKKINVTIQRTHTEKGKELYGSQMGDEIVLAAQTCYRDGGPSLLVETLVHEMLHYIDPSLTESQVEEIVKKHRRKYKVLYACALKIIERFIQKS